MALQGEPSPNDSLLEVGGMRTKQLDLIPPWQGGSTTIEQMSRGGLKACMLLGPSVALKFIMIFFPSSVEWP